MKEKRLALQKKKKYTEKKKRNEQYLYYSDGVISV